MRLYLVVLASLLVLAPAVAQPAPPDRGVYGVFGNASPERTLFPIGTDPVVSVGARLSRHVDVHVGFRGRTVQSPPFARERDADGNVVLFPSIDRTRSRTGTVGVGVTAPVGAARAEVRASAAFQDLRFTSEPTVFQEPSRGEVETGSSQLAHAGVSASVALPVGAGRAGAVPGVGLAVAGSSVVGGPAEARRDYGMAFARLPISVLLAGRSTVTLDLMGGARRALSGVTRWNPEFSASVRVDL